MQQKRSSWIYVVLGLMLFSLIIFSGLPLVNSIVAGDRLNSTPNTAYDTTVSGSELVKLEAEASGYQKVLAREPENETALRGLINIKLQQKDLTSAIEPLAQLAKIHAEQTEYTVLLAQAKQQLADYEGAAAAYRQVLQTVPGDLFALGGIANLYLSQNLPERAISLLKATIERGKQNQDESAKSIDIPSVELLLGELYTNQQQYDDAIAIYDEVATINQEDFRPVLAKAMVLEQQGDIEGAKPLLDNAYTLAPVEFKDQIRATINKLSVSSDS